MFIAIAKSGIDVSILRPAAAHWKRTICGGPTGTTDMPTKWASQVILSLIYSSKHLKDSNTQS